ncbi:MAG: hypothetical protein IJV96_05030 [Clostridia bacterium]|nr:hypothetical protein [Clostridia bacterium]
MRRRSAKRAWLENRDLLLFLVFSVSLLLFFGCLLLIPRAESTPLLRGCALLLSLCLPALFYLRSENGETFALWGRKKQKISPLRLLPFALAALLLGVFVAELFDLSLGKELLFSRFAYENAFSLAGLASALTYAFASALLSFGFLENQLSSQGRAVSLVAPAIVFAALAAAPKATPVLFLIGLMLALSQPLFGGLAPLLGSFAFTVGGYFASVGLFTSARLPFVTRPVFLLVAGLLSLILLFVAFYRVPLRAALQSRVRTQKRPAVFWGSFSLLVLLLSLFYSLFLTKWIG